MKNQAYSILAELTHLNRTLNSRDTEKASYKLFSYITDADSVAYTVDRFTPGTPAWTWKIPPRWNFNECTVKNHRNGETVFTSCHPLSVGSYSIPVHRFVLGEQLLRHVHCEEIPRFRYHYYAPHWSISMRPHQYDQIDPAGIYRVDLDSRFDYHKPMTVTTIKLQRGEGRRLLLVAHIDHPCQANDGLSGVAVGVDVMNHLIENIDIGDVTLLICPETIGSIAYFARYPHESYDGAIFLEMLGSSGPIKIQHSTQGLDAYIDRVATTMLPNAETFPFRELVCNDEMVIDGPGVDIPCISISRYPYPEYHTERDTLSIIDEEALDEAVAAIYVIADEFVSGYTYRRNFDGPIFLSKYGLWSENMSTNLAYEKIMLELKTPKTIADIAYNTGLDYNFVNDFIKNTRTCGLTIRETYAPL